MPPSTSATIHDPGSMSADVTNLTRQRPAAHGVRDGRARARGLRQPADDGEATVRLAVHAERRLETRTERNRPLRRAGQTVAPAQDDEHLAGGELEVHRALERVVERQDARHARRIQEDAEAGKAIGASAEAHLPGAVAEPDRLAALRAQGELGQVEFSIGKGGVGRKCSGDIEGFRDRQIESAAPPPPGTTNFFANPTTVSPDPAKVSAMAPPSAAHDRCPGAPEGPFISRRADRVQ